MVVSMTQFLEGCHYQRSFSFLPHGSLHEAAHNIAAKFFRVSKRESERGEQEGSQRLCNLLWDVESSREDSTGILTRSKSVGPVHTQWEGLQMNTRRWESQGAFLKAANHKHIATTFPLPLLHYCEWSNILFIIASSSSQWQWLFIKCFLCTQTFSIHSSFILTTTP